MADPQRGSQPPGVPNDPGVPRTKRRRSGCLVVFLVLLLVAVLLAACAVGLWLWYLRPEAGEGVGSCFPAATDGPLDTSHGTVGCSHPNAIWQVTRVIDGPHSGDVLGTCGPDGDMLIYLPEEDRSYCLDYIN
jgi:hypothetical protein